MTERDLIAWLGGESNIKIEEYLAQDQFLNETPKGFRITHKPTQIRVCVSERKKYENKKEALLLLIDQVRDYYYTKF